MFIKPHELEIVKSILRKYLPEYEVWAFGSRVHGRSLKKFSDLDLVVITDESVNSITYADIKEAFSESDLPFKVDIVDWSKITDNFREIIKKDHEII